MIPVIFCVQCKCYLCVTLRVIIAADSNGTRCPKHEEKDRLLNEVLKERAWKRGEPWEPWKPWDRVMTFWTPLFQNPANSVSEETTRANEVESRNSFKPPSSQIPLFLSVATLQILAVKNVFWVQILGGEKLLEKCRWEIFKRQERGLDLFGRVSDRFPDPFSRFWKHFSYWFENYWEAISFCRRAALTLSAHHKVYGFFTRMIEHQVSVAIPAEPRGEKNTFFLCNFWAVKNF